MRKAGDIAVHLFGVVLIFMSGVLMVFGGIPYPKLILLPPVVSVSVLVGGVALLIGKNTGGQELQLVRIEKHQKASGGTKGGWS